MRTMEKVFAMTVREAHVLTNFIANTKQSDRFSYSSLAKVDGLKMHYYIGFDKQNLDLLDGYDFLTSVIDGYELSKVLDVYDLGIFVNLLSRFGV